MPQPKLKVQLKKFHPEAIVPEYKSEMAAAFDLHACIPYRGGRSCNCHRVKRTSSRLVLASS
jgi:dUTPase